MIPTYRKKLKRIILALLILWLLVLVISIVFSSFFEDFLVRKIKSSINDNLKSEIRIARKDISFTLVKTFPHAGLRLDNLTVFEPQNCRPSGTSDTLLFVERCYIVFNLSPLLHKEVDLHRISFSDGFISLHRFANNKVNYAIWEPDTVSQNTADSVRFSIGQFGFKNVLIRYTDIPNQVKVRYPVQKGIIKANYSNKTFTVQVGTSCSDAELMVRNTTYAQHQQVDLEFTTIFQKGRTQIEKGKATVGGIPVNVNLSYNEKSAPLFSCKFSAPAIELQKLKGTDILDLDKKYGVRLKRGNIQLDGVVTKTSKSVSTQSAISFYVKDAVAQMNERKLLVTDMIVRGKYVYGVQGSNLQLDSIFLKSSASQIAGSISMYGSNLQYIQTKLSAQIQLSDLGGFFNDSLPLKPKGTFDAQLSFKGKLPKETHALWTSLLSSGMVGHIAFNSLEWDNQALPAIIASGSLQLMPGYLLKIHQLTWQTPKSQMSLHGQVQQYQGIFDDRYSAIARLGFVSEAFDTREFSADHSASNPSSIGVPPSIEVHLDGTCKQMITSRLAATNITLQAQASSKFVDIKKLSFDAFDGTIKAQGRLITQSNLSQLNANVDFESIAIKPLFEAYNNFGQEAIVAENLGGKLSAHTSLAFQIDDSLQIIKPSIEVDALISILNGELVNYQPLEELSRFIAVDELKHVTFDKLKTHLVIKDEQIAFDRTNIFSSAVDFSAEGRHSFDNAYEYHIDVVLSDILWGKARRKKQNNTEFGYVANDPSKQKTLPLVIKGLGEEVHVAYDRKTSRNRLKESIANQKTELGISPGQKTESPKQVEIVFESDTLHPKQNTSKKSANTQTETQKRTGNKDNQSEFIIEWEDE